MANNFEYLRPGQIQEILAKTPIAYLPWGAHEWHGKQNPLGVDAIKALRLCELACEQTGGVVFPPVYCGYKTMKPHADFKQTLEFSGTVVALLVKEYLEQLADEGFKVIVILMGHYGRDHMDIIYKVVEAFNSAHPGVRAWAFPDYEATLDAGYPGDHAGNNETSYMLYFFPELTDLSALPPREEFDAIAEGVHGGYPPEEASAERGEAQVKAFLEYTVPRVKQLLESLQD